MNVFDWSAPAPARCRLSFGVLMLVLLTPSAHAAVDGARPPWWRTVAVQAQLGLTAAQVTQIDTLYTRSLSRRRLLRSQLMQWQDRLARAMTNGIRDERQAARLVEHVVEAGRRTNVARTMLLVHIYQVLTPAQRSRLEHLSAPARASGPR